MSTKVLVLGSCRVHGPMGEIAATGRCGYYNGGSRAYLHTVREAVQRLQWARGECAIPNRLAPYLFAIETTPALAEEHTRASANCDFLLVEISSEKELVCNGLYLQLNYLHRHLLSSLGELGTIWWQDLIVRGEPSRKIVKDILNSSYFSEAGFSDADESILRDTRCVIADRMRLHEGLADLKTLWSKPMAAISHVGLPLLDGSRLKGREDFIERLRHVGQDLDVPVFEPGGLIQQVGRKLTLERDGADIDHLNPNFEQMYGWYLLNRIIKPGLARTAVSAA